MATESRGFHRDLSLFEADNVLHQGDRLSVSKKPSPERVSESHLDLCSVMPAGGSGHILGARDGDGRWAAPHPPLVPQRMESNLSDKDSEWACLRGHRRYKVDAQLWTLEPDYLGFKS